MPHDVIFGRDFGGNRVGPTTIPAERRHRARNRRGMGGPTSGVPPSSRMDDLRRWTIYVAGRSASRGNGFSSMGMWTMAANTPKKIPAHHIMSYEPVRS